MVVYAFILYPWDVLWSLDVPQVGGIVFVALALIGAATNRWRVR